MKSSFTTRMLTLMAVVLAAVFIGNMLVIGYASMSGVNLTSESDLISLLNDTANVPYVKALIGLNHFLTFIIGPLIFLMIFYHHRVATYLQLRHFDARLLMLFPVALFSLYPLISYVTFYVEMIDFPDFLKSMDEDSFDALYGLLKMDGPLDLLLNLLIIAILPGIGEELLFRGIIQKEIFIKTSRPHVAIWVTAFIFAAFHLQITGLFAKFMIGLVLGYAYYYSRSLILPMMLHSLNNGLATVGYYFQPDDLDMENITTEPVSIVSVLIFTAIFAATMFYIRSISDIRQQFP